MMEINLINGDYVPDGLGGVRRSSGADALLMRVLYRLTARRGQFPFLPELGSRLYLLGQEPPSQRLTAARQFIAEALASEDVEITDVVLSPLSDGHLSIAVFLSYQGDDLTVTLQI